MKHFALTLCALLLSFTSAKAETASYCDPHARPADGWIIRFGQREFRVCSIGLKNKVATFDLQTVPLIGEKSLLSQRETGFNIFDTQRFGTIPDRIQILTQLNGKPQKLRQWDGRDYSGWESKIMTSDGLVNSLFLFWLPTPSLTSDPAQDLPAHMLSCNDQRRSPPKMVSCYLDIADGTLRFNISLFAPGAPPSIQEPIPNLSHVIKEALILYRAAEVTDANRAELTNVPRFPSH